MLHRVDVGIQSIAAYASSASEKMVEELRALAAPLRGARVLHLHATPYGGGVAEILRSEVPLLRDLGLAAEWQLITGDDAFFSVTKAIHNGLQGASRDLSPVERETYLANATRNAHLLDGTYDLVVIHDPQPLAIRQFHGNGDARWIWRCHALGAEDDSPTLDIVRAATTRLRAALTGRDTARF